MRGQLVFISSLLVRMLANGRIWEIVISKRARIFHVRIRTNRSDLSLCSLGTKYHKTGEMAEPDCLQMRYVGCGYGHLHIRSVDNNDTIVKFPYITFLCKTGYSLGNPMPSTVTQDHEIDDWK